MPFNHECVALKFSIIIPARNEAENLPPTVTALADGLDRRAIDYEILIVDDHSTDATAAVAKELERRNPRCRLVENLLEPGFGRAVRSGLQHYLGDAVVILMADASDDPADVVKYYEALASGCDCVFGSRFAKGSVVTNYPLFKLLLNRLVNFAIRVLFLIRYNDVTNAFKAYRRETIEGLEPLIAPHFNLTVEMPLKAIVRGYSYKVLPINWCGRRKGVSKLKLQEMGSRYLFVVLYVWLEKLLSRDDYAKLK